MPTPPAPHIGRAATHTQVHGTGHHLVSHDFPTMLDGDLLSQLPSAGRDTPAQNPAPILRTPHRTPALRPHPSRGAAYSCARTHHRPYETTLTNRQPTYCSPTSIPPTAKAGGPLEVHQWPQTRSGARRKAQIRLVCGLCSDRRDPPDHVGVLFQCIAELQDLGLGERLSDDLDTERKPVGGERRGHRE